MEYFWKVLGNSLETGDYVRSKMCGCFFFSVVADERPASPQAIEICCLPACRRRTASFCTCFPWIDVPPCGEVFVCVCGGWYDDAELVVHGRSNQP